MQRILSRSVWLQRKFISLYTKVRQYEMVLYNEKPQPSLVMRFDEGNKKSYQPHVDAVKSIKSRFSKMLCFSQSNDFVLHTNSGRINKLIKEERIENKVTPEISLAGIVKWWFKTPDSGNKDSIAPGTRLGRLDAANEGGFFHRTNRSRLEEIKKKLKDKVDTEPTVPKKGG